MLPYQTISHKEDGIAIIGLGGAGANILHCFGGSSADNVKLCIMSLDERVGRACGNVEFLQLGSGLNHGLGSGGDPDVGRQAARESSGQISNLLKDTRLLVLVAGLGGGTGSGAAPVLAAMAREAGLFLVSVLVMPFAFEGRRRREQAERALEEVSALSDIVFCFENDYMEELFRNRSGARAVFEEVDRLLAKATASVPMLANSPGLINLGLDELAAALENNDSRCIFGSGSGYGPHRAEDAARAALASPLVSFHRSIRFARTAIVHIAGGDSMSLTEIRRAMETVRAALADEDVRLFFGTTVKPKLGDEMRVTLIASVDAAEVHAALLAEEEAKQAAAEAEAARAAEQEPQEEAPAPAEDEESPAEEEAEAPAASAPLGEEQEDEGAEEEESGEELFPNDDEEEDGQALAPRPAPRAAPQAAPLRQGELMPAAPPAAAPAPALPKLPPSAKTVFPDDDEDSALPSAGAPSRYAPDATRHRPRAATPANDLDTPPALRFNDLRDMF